MGSAREEGGRVWVTEWKGDLGCRCPGQGVSRLPAARPRLAPDTLPRTVAAHHHPSLSAPLVSQVCSEVASVDDLNPGIRSSLCSANVGVKSGWLDLEWSRLPSSGLLSSPGQRRGRSSPAIRGNTLPRYLQYGVAGQLKTTFPRLPYRQGHVTKVSPGESTFSKLSRHK